MVDLLHAGIIRQVARRAVQDRSIDDYAELEQELLFRAWRNWDQIQSHAYGPLTAWLKSTARNIAVDTFRRAERRPSISGDLTILSSDDELAASISESYDAEIVVLAMSHAASAGDAAVVRIVVEWLLLAERSGSTPSLRQVAERSGVTHPTVASALTRFGRYVIEMQNPNA